MKQRLVAESIGTAMLVLAIVGSGIMAQRLSAANPGQALLANAIATGCALLVLITVLGPVSGAHFNPLVSGALAMLGEMPVRDAIWYVLVQFIAGIVGACLANALFDLPLAQASTHERSGWPLLASEAVAAFGLLLTIRLGESQQPQRVPMLVAAYITAAYWFTPSTSFANPAVTVARAFTDTFTGIRPIDVMPFVAAQIVGAVMGVMTARWLSTKLINSPWK